MATFQRLKERLKKTASVLPTLHNRHPSYRGNSAITMLRIFLWLMPAAFMPLLALLGGLLGSLLPSPATIISLMLILWVIATAGVGFFEESLRFQQMRISLARSKYELVTSTVYFVILQIVIAPTAFIAAVIGFAALASRFI